MAEGEGKNGWMDRKDHAQKEGRDGRTRGKGDAEQREMS